MKKIPKSTYRLQFNKDFKFADAFEIVEYLSNLGISTVYASPVFSARKGSMHGYDVTDPSKINSEIGTEEEFFKLIDECKKYGMDWMQDIVPNHMSYNIENKYLIDVLENGPSSRYYNFFDIEWNHPFASSKERVLAPFLGKFYKETLESGDLKLGYQEEGFRVNYYDSQFPVKLDSYVDILSPIINKLKRILGRNNPDVIKLLGVIYTLKSFPGIEEIDERYDQIKFSKALLWELYSGNEAIKEKIDEVIQEYNGKENDPVSFNQLDKLLSSQYFRLAFWKVANEEINYRRFFSINELISLRMEREEVFNKIHKYVLGLLNEKKITGLRIDHVDGLYDPTGYLINLRKKAEDAYIVVEKILDLEEEFPAEWPVEGTTGYEFANYTAGLLCRGSNRRSHEGIYSRFIKRKYEYYDLIYEKKRLIIKTRMVGEVERLAFLVEGVSSKDRYGIDFTMFGLKQALEDLLTYFPIYRTYVNKQYHTKRDKMIIENTLEKAKAENPRYINEFNYIGMLLMNSGDEYTSDEFKERSLDFAMKFQQLTGPLMAKGFEDTTLYIYNRLISLNEVGGNPGKFGISQKEFHNYNAKRAKNLKSTLNTTSSHDTKRGEDIRMRINVLSELPEEWGEKVKHWNNLNRKYKIYKQRREIPIRNEEYFLYQTLLGAYPNTEEDLEKFPDRIKEYMIKAVREAKVNSTWIKPNEEYENYVKTFIEQILIDNDENIFLQDFKKFQKIISFYGFLNSMSQVLIKMMSPGVPDFYQGTELWDFSLVDPDNRRPVDFGLRKKYLDEISLIDDTNYKKQVNEYLRDYSSGKIKMFIIYKLLKVRKEFADLFESGSYTGIKSWGKYARNIFSFIRVRDEKRLLVIAPRFFTDIVQPEEIPLREGWGDTYLSTDLIKGKAINLLTNEEIQITDKIMLKDILIDLPIAVLSY